MDTGKNSETKQLHGPRSLKEAVIAVFREPATEAADRLASFSVRDWHKTMYWLDASGLTLYLLDRLTQIGRQACLPPAVLARLRQNLLDNRRRTDALFAETVTVSRAFQQNQIPFAVLKGCTLAPDSVADSALRFQGDIDFLIAENDASAALQILNALRYRLCIAGRDAWEFKSGPPEISKIGDLYKIHAQRIIELQLESAVDESSSRSVRSRLTRAQYRSIQGVQLPTLCPVDLFLDQALHLFKHICDEHTRASWILEFHRNVQTHKDDVAFWRELRWAAAAKKQSDVALGVVTVIATYLFGTHAPEELTSWTVKRLPAAVNLWVEMFGSRVPFTNFPGSKLYLILRRQLQGDRGLEQASARRLVFPFHRPPGKFGRPADERPLMRFARYRSQAIYIVCRLRFHIVEGLRYGMAQRRWKQRLGNSGFSKEISGIN